MRLFEVLIAAMGLLLLLYLASGWKAVGARRVALLALLTAGLLAVHWGVEGYRWQMVPLYGLAAGLLLVGAWRARARRQAAEHGPQRRRGAGRAWAGGVVWALAWLLALALPVLFPVPRLPDPGGPYGVGTSTFHWVDPARQELYGQQAGAAREVMVQLWYPAQPAPGAEPAPWMDRLDVAGPAIAHYIRLPGFALDHAALVRTHSYRDAPAAPGAAHYPVLVYSHGWNGFRTINMNQSEALASHGYLVAAVDHTYGAMVAVFDDGRVALNDPASLPAGVPEAEYQQATETLEAVYAADVRFVLDQLARVQSGAIDSPLAGRLDLARVGLFGHSTGGGAIVIACRQDVRCQAGLGMDAWLGPVPAKVIDAGLEQPFLFMRSESWASANNDHLLDRLYGGLHGAGYRMTIEGTGHYDFTLMPLFSPLAPALGLKGPLEGRRTAQIVTDYTLAFFDQHLRGRPSPLLQGPSTAYPEVKFETR